jgi:hypothetical protein
MIPIIIPIVTENTFMRKIGVLRILGVDRKKRRTRSGTSVLA